MRGRKRAGYTRQKKSLIKEYPTIAEEEKKGFRRFGKWKWPQIRGKEHYCCGGWGEAKKKVMRAGKQLYDLGRNKRRRKGNEE